MESVINMAKKITKIEKKLGKIEKLTTTQQMTTLFERLYIAYIEQSMTSEQIVGELEDIENLKFTDYNTWIPMRGLIMLKSHLCEEDSELQYVCKTRVGAVTNSGTDEQIEAFHMMLEGEITGADLLTMAKQSGDAEWEKALSIKILAQYITIVEMGASRKFGYAEAIKTLDRVLQEIRRRW
ncbi:MAG: DUF6707 family protein [Rikenellaceae bacterium]